MRGFVLFVIGAAAVAALGLTLAPRLSAWWKGESNAEPIKFVERPADAPSESQDAIPAATPADPSAGSAAAPAAEIEETPVAPAPSQPETALAPTGPQEAFRAELVSVDRTELGRLLAHEDRYQELERYLNEGDGAALPDGARKLASAFWLAIHGQPTDADELAKGLEGAEGVTSEQFFVLRSAIEGARPLSRAASGAHPDPLATGMRIALLERLADDHARKAQHAEAASAYSELVHLELSAPWPSGRDDLLRWSRSLGEAQEHSRWNPQGSWPSISYEVQGNDSLVGIRKQLVEQHPELLLCVGLIERSNGLDDRPIQPGQTLRIPTDRPHVLVDLDTRLLLYMQGEEVVGIWEVGIGMEGQETPVGRFHVGLKQENPSYMPIGGPNLPFGHPENPLGTRWIAWHVGEERTGYGIHGTNDPAGVGTRVSNGCVRMTNADVEVLFELVPVGSEVVVQP